MKIKGKIVMKICLRLPPVFSFLLLLFGIFKNVKLHFSTTKEKYRKQR